MQHDYDIVSQQHKRSRRFIFVTTCKEHVLKTRFYSGKEIWAVVSSALALARQNPTPFVSAVRIVEREEALDRALLDERGGSRGSSRPLPPGRPRCWRARFFQVSAGEHELVLEQVLTFLTARRLLQVLEEAVSARFRSVSYLHTRGPGLAGHLSALQHSIMADLATVRHLLEHCVPPHYQLTGAYLRASHCCLHAHLIQVSGKRLRVLQTTHSSLDIFWKTSCLEFTDPSLKSKPR